MSAQMTQFVRVSNEKIKNLVHITKDNRLSLSDLGLYMMLSAILANPSFRYAQGGLQHLLLGHCKNRYFSLHASWNRISSSGYLARTRIPTGKNQFRDFYRLSHTPKKEKTVHLSVKEGKEFLASYAPFLPPEEDFTKVSYAVLMDERLSLSAKGLYAVIARQLRLSEHSPNRNLTKTLLHSFCHIGENAFSAVFRELRVCGYLCLTSSYDEKGKHRYYQYALYETPQDLTKQSETALLHTKQKQKLPGACPWKKTPTAKPVPVSESSSFISRQASEEHPPAREILRTTDPPPDQMPFIPFPESKTEESLRQAVKNQIEYDCLCASFPKEKLDCIVSILVSFYRACRSAGQMFLTARGGIRYPKEEAARKLAALDSEDIRFVLDTSEKQEKRTRIHHLRAYLTTCLFHAKEDFALSLESFANHALPLPSKKIPE